MVTGVTPPPEYQTATSTGEGIISSLIERKSSYSKTIENMRLMIWHKSVKCDMRVLRVPVTCKLIFRKYLPRSSDIRDMRDIRYICDILDMRDICDMHDICDMRGMRTYVTCVTCVTYVTCMNICDMHDIRDMRDMRETYMTRMTYKTCVKYVT